MMYRYLLCYLIVVGIISYFTISDILKIEEAMTIYKEKCCKFDSFRLTDICKETISKEYIFLISDTDYQRCLNVPSHGISLVVFALTGFFTTGLVTFCIIKCFFNEARYVSRWDISK